MIKISDDTAKMIRMDKTEINQRAFFNENKQDCSNCFYRNLRKGLYREREMLIAIRDANDSGNFESPVTREAVLNCIRIARREVEQRGIIVHIRQIEALFNKEKQTCGITYDSRIWANHDMHDLEKFIEEIADVLESLSASDKINNKSETEERNLSRFSRFEAFMKKIWEA